MEPRTGIAARKAAIDLLDAVLTRKASLDTALATTPRFNALTGPDRSFARLIASVSLRHLGEIDAAIDKLLRKPIANSALNVRQTLRVGAAQLMFLETPPHAAVDTAVTSLKGSRFAGFSGLANAILRQISPDSRMPIEAAAHANTPQWLLKSWAQAFGETNALAIAVAHGSEAPIDITPKTEVARISETLGGQTLPTGSIRLDAPRDVRQLPRFEDGDWWIQDAAAALPARLIPNPGGKHILDLCAAPGGKSAQLASRGARMTSIDRSAERLETLQQNFERLGLRSDIVHADIENWNPAELADAVLLDAPCSATGTIRRHPDIPHLKQLEDVRRMAKIQSRLIASAARMVRPGGHLIYAVCSLQPEEGARVINKFLLANTEFSRAPLQEDEHAIPSDFRTKNGDVQTLPCHWPELGGLDGFFAARLVRHAAS